MYDQKKHSPVWTHLSRHDGSRISKKLQRDDGGLVKGSKNTGTNERRKGEAEGQRGRGTKERKDKERRTRWGIGKSFEHVPNDQNRAATRRSTPRTARGIISNKVMAREGREPLHNAEKGALLPFAGRRGTGRQAFKHGCRHLICQRRCPSSQ